MLEGIPLICQSGNWQIDNCRVHFGWSNHFYARVKLIHPLKIPTVLLRRPLNFVHNLHLFGKKTMIENSGDIWAYIQLITALVSVHQILRNLLFAFSFINLSQLQKFKNIISHSLSLSLTDSNIICFLLLCFIYQLCSVGIFGRFFSALGGNKEEKIVRVHVLCSWECVGWLQP